MTFGRVPIGNSDFSLSYYSYDDTADDVNMTNFAFTTFETETRVRIIPLTNGTLPQFTSVTVLVLILLFRFLIKDDLRISKQKVDSKNNQHNQID